jgi:hypothetical protein
MAQHSTPLANHLNGLIYLADVVWRGPPEKYADMARTFRRLGRAYEIAALTKRTDDL